MRERLVLARPGVESATPWSQVRLGYSSSWIVASTSHPVFYSCTGCRYAGGFSSSCVSLCTVCIMTELQPTSTTSCNLWIACRTARPGLRSENSQNYYVPRVRTKLGERAFSYAGPVVWNYLPVYIRAEPDITRLKNILKTYF